MHKKTIDALVQEAKVGALAKKVEELKEQKAAYQLVMGAEPEVAEEFMYTEAGEKVIRFYERWGMYKEAHHLARIVGKEEEVLGRMATGLLEGEQYDKALAILDYCRKAGFEELPDTLEAGLDYE